MQWMWTEKEIAIAMKDLAILQEIIKIRIQQAQREELSMETI